MAALIGYTGEINERELALPSLRRVQGRASKSARRASRSSTRSGCAGREGRRFVEVDARNRVVRDNGVRPEEPAEAPPPLQHQPRPRPAALRPRVLRRFAARRASSRWIRRRAACSRCTARPRTTSIASSAACRRSTTPSLMDDPLRPMSNRAIQGTVCAGVHLQAGHGRHRPAARAGDDGLAHAAAVHGAATTMGASSSAGTRRGTATSRSPRRSRSHVTCTSISSASGSSWRTCSPAA